jgi:hemerythrin
MAERSLFIWDASKFSVSVASMDQEHQQLILIMNRLHEMNQAKATKPELMGILKELATYTVKHFKDEEAYFEKLPNYPHAAAHKKGSPRPFE